MALTYDVIMGEVDRILKLTPPKGDREIAWAVLGFGATTTNPHPQRPTLNDFLLRVNRILHRVAPRNLRAPIFPHLTNIQRRRCLLKAKNCVKRILESLHIIGSFHQRYIGHAVPDSWHRFQFFPNDRSRLAPPWNNIAPPMDLAHFQAHINGILPNYMRPEPPPGFDSPSVEEEILAVATRRADRIANAYMQPPFQDVILGQPNGLHVRFHSGAGDGNCYWYAISGALGNPYTHFEHIKSNILRYYMSILRDPTHIRYRMYTMIEMNSRLRSVTFGETSLSRSLHFNEYNGSWPTYTPRKYLGLNQVVADYYHVEVVELDDVRNYNKGHHTVVTPPLRYVPRARGDSANRQIIIAEEEHHFFSVSLLPPVASDYRIPTQHLDRVDDYFPWNKGVNLVGVLPLALPAHSGFNNPTTHVLAHERLWPRAGLPVAGFLPRLPTPRIMNRWDHEVPPLGEGPDPQLGDSPYYAAFGRPPLGKVPVQKVI